MTRQADVRTGATASLCFACGYDLTGLELPHVCPECGRVADPQKELDTARQWFSKPGVSYRWLFRPSTVPVALCYALGNTASLRLARRRRFACLWLPALLTTLVVAIGSCVTMEYKVTYWYHAQGDPLKTPIDKTQSSEWDRLYSFSGFYRGLNARLISPSGQVLIENRSRTRSRFVFEVPGLFDELTFNFIWLFAPWLALIGGYYPALLIMGRNWRRDPESHELLPNTRNALACASVMAGPLGVCLWLWVATAVVVGVRTLLVGDQGNLDWLFVPLWCLLGMWCVTATIGWPILVSHDRARLLFPHPILAAVLMSLATIAVPIAVSMLLM